jgi:hypothetical protein
MIQIRSNAAEVGAAFREIARNAPDVAARVIKKVGFELRKDVIGSIQGRGPIAVAPRGPIAQQRANGTPQGGRIGGAIRYKADGKSATIRSSKWDVPYFVKYQTAEDREFTDTEKRRFVRMQRPGTGYVAPAMVEKYVDALGLRYSRPARPVIGPLAQSGMLADRIRSVSTKMLESMARTAARKARKALRAA